jgi:hypothetical protein
MLDGMAGPDRATLTGLLNSLLQHHRGLLDYQADEAAVGGTAARP